MHPCCLSWYEVRGRKRAGNFGPKATQVGTGLNYPVGMRMLLERNKLLGRPMARAEPPWIRFDVSSHGKHPLDLFENDPWRSTIGRQNDDM
jgi:hypothetical protein